MTRDPHDVVGRRSELAALSGALSAARDGRPALVLVTGAARSGKTSLVDRLLGEQDDVEVVRTSGVSWERHRPFGVLGHVLSGIGAAPPEPERDAAAQGALLREAWSARSADRPLVVLVDDAQHADLGSLRALCSAVRCSGHERVLVLLVCNEDAVDDPELRDLLGHQGNPTVHVGQLSTVDTQELALRVAGVDLSPATARRLSAHARGNPADIAALLRELPAQTWRGWPPNLPAPHALTTSIAHTMRGWNSDTRALAEAAATLGDAVPFAQAAELSGIADPVAALDETTRAGVLLPDEGRGLSALRFASALVRAAVHSSITPLRRQELHRAAAEVARTERERLSHRVALSPFPDAALAAELDAFADRRAAQGAWAVAGAALIDASHLSPDAADRESRLVRAVDALAGAGDLPRAQAFIPVLESFAPSALRDAVLGYVGIMLGRPAEAEAMLTDAWSRCDPETDPQIAALICQRRVLHSMAHWHGPELVRWCRRAVRLAPPGEPAAVESEAILGLGLAATGRIPQARSAYAAVSGRLGPGAQAQRVQMGRGWLELALDDPLAARRALHGAVPTEYRQGSTRISLWAQAWLARAEFALGDWDEALRTVNGAAARLEDSGMELVRPLVHWTGAQAHALRGDWEAAHEHLRLAAADGHTYEVMLIPAGLARAQCAEAQADYDTVLRSLRPLADLHPREGIDEPGFWPWQDVYANALVVTNQVDEADEFLRPHEALAARREHRSAQARLGYVRGRIAGARGDIDAAKETFEKSLRLLEPLPLPYERARVSFAYGQTLRRAGKRREADLLLQQARDAFHALGARSYVRRCDRELKAGGLHAKRATDLTGLTAQERAVAGLVAAGMTNKQAAVELYVSVKTVQFHLTRIYAKLGIASRTELAACFREDG